MKYEISKPYEMHPDKQRFDLSRLGRHIACRLLYAWLRYRQWRRENEAIRHLRQIDDHLLEDVGIDRREIDAVVRDRSGIRNTAYHHPSPPPIDPCSRMAV